MLPKRHENVTLDFGYFQVIFEYFRTKSLEKRWKKILVKVLDIYPK